MDAILYAAIGVNALTVVIAIAAIVNAIRINRQMHSERAAAEGKGA